MTPPTRPGEPTGAAEPPGGTERLQQTGQITVLAEGRCRAPVDAVWSLVGEAHRWREWSFITRSDLVREGAPTADGVGAVRRFTIFGIGSREEVLDWDPPRHLAYTILRGFPVRNHRADVTVEADHSVDPPGTIITWTARFDPKLPGTAMLMKPLMRALLRDFVRRVTRTADEQAAPAGPPPS